MPHYGDDLNQVGKSLRKTKENTEAALRRVYPIVPKIERVRDTFDSVQPFEMTFFVEHEEVTVTADFIFNKPPPICSLDDIKMCCDAFVVGSGAHLLQLTSAYIAGHTFVVINGVRQLLPTYEERDPLNGYVYVFGTTAVTQYIDICYLRDIS